MFHPNVHLQSTAITTRLVTYQSDDVSRILATNCDLLVHAYCTIKKNRSAHFLELFLKNNRK